MISLIEKFFAFFAKEIGLTNSASRTLNSISNYRNRAGAGRGRDIGHTVQSQALPENSFSAKKRRKVHKVYQKRKCYCLLVMGADTDDSKPLRLEERFVSLCGALNETGAYEIHRKFRIGKEDIVQQIGAEHPDLLHFVGHGDISGALLLHTGGGGCAVEPLLPEDMKGVLEFCAPWLKVIFLGACYSLQHARIAAESIDAAIGMSAEISVDAELQFAKALYLSLASGASLADSFNCARSQLKLLSPTHADVPVLCLKNGVSAENIKLMPKSLTKKGG